VVVLVLRDMVMPRMDGAACFHALRKLRAVPILLVSGYPDHTSARELRASGAMAFSRSHTRRSSSPARTTACSAARVVPASS
jgi:CheY-like chemotaxis protein